VERSDIILDVMVGAASGSRRLRALALARRSVHGVAVVARRAAVALVVVLGLLTGLVGCGGSHAAAPPWVLDVPTSDQGFQLRLPDFEVPVDSEDQRCFFVQVPDLADGQDFWIDHVRFATSTGTHHLNVFRVRTIVDLDPAAGVPVKIGPYDGTLVDGGGDYANNPCWGSANWADWPLVANTQSPVDGGPYTDWVLPDGVAFRFSPGEMLMVQAHYVNSSIQPTPVDAEVGINFYRSADATPIELGTMFGTQQSIRICQSNPTPTFSGTCRLPGAVTVTAANGHFHSRGRDFSMYVWDGTSTDHPPSTDQFYESRSWNDPVMATGIDRAVPDGGGVWWDCSYQWSPPMGGCDAVNAKDPEQANDCCYVFGGTTDLGEHCNAFVYYYPKGSTDVFCN
jgi:hypothetical protein